LNEESQGQLLSNAPSSILTPKFYAFLIGFDKIEEFVSSFHFKNHKKWHKFHLELIKNVGRGIH
jgi:hypothetical protein